MKFKFLALVLFSALTISYSNAQTTSRESAHNKAHKELLANKGRSSIDKSAIDKMIKNDVMTREEEKASSNAVSKETNDIISDLLKEAQTHIGKKYVWATKGPNTFDCSGFTSYVYKQLGYKISSGSRMQYTQGKAVDRKNLRKGDLVFFTSRRSGNNVGHVGIVWEVMPDGGFKFIHASVKGVKISDFEGYYVPRYVGARRIID